MKIQLRTGIKMKSILSVVLIALTMSAFTQNSVTRKYGIDKKLQPKKILYLVSNEAKLKGYPVGFFAEELTRPFNEFIKAGYDVDLVSPKGGKVIFDLRSDPENDLTLYPNDLVSIGFKHHKNFGKLMENTPSITDVNIADYDALVVAGGGGPLVTFKDDKKLHKFVADFYEQEKVVALICHGTSLLLWTELSDGTLLADGKTWTGFSDAEEELSNKSAGFKINEYTIETEAKKNSKTNYESVGAFKPYAIRDGRLITGQQQNSSELFAELIIEALSEEQNEPVEVSKPRLKIHDYDSFEEKQKQLYNYITDAIGKNDDGTIGGPFDGWLLNPDLLENAMKMGQMYLGGSGTELSGKLVEMTVLIIAQEYQSPYEWYAHLNHAKRLGLSDDIIDSILHGQQPQFTDSEESLVYNLVKELLKTSNLSDASYTKAVNKLGETKLVELTNLVGFYQMVSLHLNTFKVPAPNGASNPFK